MSETKRNEKEGLFLSIEGPDGAGKTTQAGLLKSRLETCGIEVFLTREPGGTLIGEEIRKVLLNAVFSEMTVACEILLYSAARAQLVNQVIHPSLKKGMIVISDRYLDSNLVYQGLAGGEKPEIIETINVWATGGLIPEITFLLDIDAQTGLERLQKKCIGRSVFQADRMEQKNLEFHSKVRQGFLKLATSDPERFFVIDAGDRPDAIHEKIWGKIELLLRKKNFLS
jgi:dTMP kinase